MPVRRYYMTAVLAFLGAVFFAGCSSSQSGSALPNSAVASKSVPRGTGGMAERKRSYLRFLKKQIEGKLPHYLPRKLLEAEYAQVQQSSARVPRVQRDVAPVSIWAGNAPSEYLLGMTKKGKVIRAIDLPPTVGAECVPSSIKVDPSQNVWLNCAQAEDSYDAIGGAYAELDSSGNPINSYYWSPPTLPCPPSAIQCYALNGHGDDGVANESYVIAAVASTETASCAYGQYGGQCNLITGTGYEWWSKNDPSAFPTFVNLTGCCGYEDVKSVGYVDLDPNGNLLFDYFGTNYRCYYGGYGIGKIENPTSASWTFVDLIPACSGPFAQDAPGGLYVSHTDTTNYALNITGMLSRQIYRYALPITASSTYTTLGPTRKNREGGGSPISGNFGLNDEYAVLGDNAGWVDFGKVVNNKWRVISNFNLSGADPSAALTPSDK